MEKKKLNFDIVRYIYQETSSCQRTRSRILYIHKKEREKKYVLVKIIGWIYNFLQVLCRKIDNRFNDSLINSIFLSVSWREIYRFRRLIFVISKTTLSKHIEQNYVDFNMIWWSFDSILNIILWRSITLNTNYEFSCMSLVIFDRNNVFSIERSFSKRYQLHQSFSNFEFFQNVQREIHRNNFHYPVIVRISKMSVSRVRYLFLQQIRHSVKIEISTIQSKRFSDIILIDISNIFLFVSSKRREELRNIESQFYLSEKKKTLLWSEISTTFFIFLISKEFQNELSEIIN